MKQYAPDKTVVSLHCTVITLIEQLRQRTKCLLWIITPGNYLFKCKIDATIVAQESSDTSVCCRTVQTCFWDWLLVERPLWTGIPAASSGVGPGWGWRTTRGWRIQRIGWRSSGYQYQKMKEVQELKEDSSAAPVNCGRHIQSGELTSISDSCHEQAL